MSRSKYNTKSPSENPNFVSQTVATILSKAGVIDYCLTLLKALLEYWKTYVFIRKNNIHEISVCVSI